MKKFIEENEGLIVACVVTGILFTMLALVILFQD